METLFYDGGMILVCGMTDHFRNEVLRLLHRIVDILAEKEGMNEEPIDCGIVRGVVANVKSRDTEEVC